MKKYCIVIGNNPELSKQVQEALFNAGFKWRGGSSSVHSGVVLVFVNHDRSGEITCCDCGDMTGECETMQCLIPSDILNGGAMKLDGAKKVDPRWFLYTTGSHSAVVATGNKKSGWMYIESAYKHNELFKWKDHCWDDEDIIILQELTASDVAYIRDNAEKAEELGMTLRKAKENDFLIGLDGYTGTAMRDLTDDYVAGYRYCKKAEPVQDGLARHIVFNGVNQYGAPKFCHNCGKLVNPVDSNDCGACGFKLVK